MMKTSHYVMLALACAPQAAMAAGLQPGLYDVNGVQEICLVDGGTWYSPTLSGWSGLWTVVGHTTHIIGNTNAGAVNDSLVIRGKGGSWTEWNDDLSYFLPQDGISFTKVAKTCTEEASR